LLSTLFFWAMTPEQCAEVHGKQARLNGIDRFAAAVLDRAMEVDDGD